MRFSELFSVTAGPDDDWFDPVVNEDTPLWVDPFLVFEDAEWGPSHDDLVAFFGVALGYVEQAQGDKTSPHWAKAERLLVFPEPKEFALGVSMGHPEGSGTESFFASQMAEALDALRRSQLKRLGYVEAFTLFCDGLGEDRISDIFCNILKARFIAYTQAVMARHGIAGERVPVRHVSWSRQNGRWLDGTVLLPRSPAFHGAVLLCPDRFLQDIPHVTRTGFWSWATTSAASILRDDLNYDLSKHFTPGERREEARKLALKRPDLALDYVDEVASQDHAAYDSKDDPKLLVGWSEAGRSAAATSEAPAAPTEPLEFCAWVGELMRRFQHAVEQTDLWRVLWNDDYTRPRQEKIVQAIASVMWAAHCESAGVDLSREVNIGRGPVDFKFSSGWSRRALTEVKLIGSSKFFTGASRQLPQYLKGEKIDCGYYVCVGFRDADFKPERLAVVDQTCAALQAEKGVSITPIYVDARPDKPSASKL
jgi:hypothetical protein